MFKHLQKKQIIWPLLVLVLEIAAYAQTRDDKNYVAGHLQSDLNNETSGMAPSSKYPGIYYIHNDSGDIPRFFAVTPEGHLKGIYNYNAVNIRPFIIRDCEDIAVGAGPAADKSYVYVADIGDNASNRSSICLYRIPEPGIPSDVDSVINTEAGTLYLNYPDGPKDAETLMIDPLEKLFYIVTKRHANVSVYTAPLNFKNKDTITLTKRCDLHFKGLQPFKWIVSGDISKDGLHVLLKSYSRVYYWRRQGTEPLWETLQRKPLQPAYEQEKLGEAISFAPNGRSYYTVSEGKKQPIYHYAVPRQ
jgi:hypothetical protein